MVLKKGSLWLDETHFMKNQFSKKNFQELQKKYHKKLFSDELFLQREFDTKLLFLSEKFNVCFEGAEKHNFFFSLFKNHYPFLKLKYLVVINSEINNEKIVVTIFGKANSQISENDEMQKHFELFVKEIKSLMEIY